TWPEVVPGLGLGAIVTARGGRTRHHIHSTWGAFFARTGLVGTLMWTWFAFGVLYYLAKRLRNGQPEWYRLQLTFWIGLQITALIFSIKSQAFWGSGIGAVQLAYMYHLGRTADVAERIRRPARVSRPLLTKRARRLIPVRSAAR